MSASARAAREGASAELDPVRVGEDAGAEAEGHAAWEGLRVVALEAEVGAAIEAESAEAEGEVASEAPARGDEAARGDEPAGAPGGAGGVVPTVARRSAAPAGRREIERLPGGLEELLTAQLEALEVKAEGGEAALAQVEALFRALHRDNRAVLRARLEEPAAGDALARLVRKKVPAGAREALMTILRDEGPAATEARAVEGSAYARAGTGGRLRARPGKLNFKQAFGWTELGVETLPLYVTLSNAGGRAIEVAGVTQEPSGGRPAGDFVVSGVSGGEQVAAGATLPLSIAFKPMGVLAKDREEPTARVSRLRVLDGDGHVTASVKLAGGARPVSEATRRRLAAQDVRDRLRDGEPVAAPATSAQMARYLDAAAEAYHEGDRGTAAALARAVATRLDEIATPAQIDEAGRRHGVGSMGFASMVGRAKSHAWIMAAQLERGSTVPVEYHVAAFRYGQPAIDVLLGEADAVAVLKASNAPYEAAQEFVVDFVEAFGDAAFAAGFAVGLVEGAGSAMWDVASGAVELVKALLGVLEDLFSKGLFGMLWNLGKQVVEGVDKLDDVAAALGAQVAARWHAGNPWAKGNFRGEVCGYVAAMIAMSAVLGPHVVAVGRWGKALEWARTIAAAGDLGEWARKLIKVPGKLKELLGGKKGAGDHEGQGGTGDVGDTGGSAGRTPDETPAGRDAEEGRAGQADEVVEPGREHLASRSDLPRTSDGSSLDRVSSVIIGRNITTEEAGHDALKRLARGDATALETVGVHDVPSDFDVSKREWGLIETREGYSLYLGEKTKTTFPGDVRAIAHTHPGKVGDRTLALDTRDGVSFAELAADPHLADNAVQNGLVPSWADFVVTADGTTHTVHTQYVHVGGGKVGNPGQADARERVSVRISDTKVARADDRNGRTFYESRIEVVAGDQVIHSGTVWTKHEPLGKTGDVFMRRPPHLDR